MHLPTLRKCSTVPPLALLALALAACVIPAPAAAQDAQEPLQTDRPDITESSNVVGAGRLQIETSVQREYFDGRRGDERSLFTPTLFRYGFHPRWEARMETDGYSRTRAFSPAAGVQRASGYSPIELGFKHHFQDPREGSMRPSLGALFHVGIPSGSSIFSTDRVTGTAKLLADFDLAPKWSLGSNLGVSLAEDDAGEVFPTALFTAALGRELTSRLRLFAEVAVFGPERSGGATGVIFDGGATYLLNLDTQLDFAVGTGVTGRTLPDVFWTIGLSRRF